VGLVLLSWNVNGIRSVHRKGLLKWLADEGPDILGIQETKACTEQIPSELRSVPGYHCIFSPGPKKGYAGVGLFSRQAPSSVRTGLGVEGLDDEGRAIVADYGRFLLYNVYFPNGKASLERLRYKLEFYERFLKHVDSQRQAGRSIVICGDLNTAHKEIDLARPRQNERISGFLPVERAWMDSLVEHGYLDTFRLFNQQPGHYSWWDLKSKARERNVGWRIDYFFVSEDLAPKISRAFIRSDVMGSDHCPVGIELEP